MTHQVPNYLLAMTDQRVIAVFEDYVGTLPSPRPELHVATSPGTAGVALDPLQPAVLFIDSQLLNQEWADFAERSGPNLRVVVLATTSQYEQGGDFGFPGAADYLNAETLTPADLRRCAHCLHRNGSAAAEAANLEQLRASEARWRGLFEADMIAQFIGDESGNINVANEAFLKLVGYDRQDLPLRWDQLTPPEYAPLDLALVEALKRGENPPPYEKEFIAKDGSRIPVLLGASLVAGKMDEGYTFVLDLRAQKAAVDALRKNEQIFKAAQSLAKLGHFTAEIGNDLGVWSDEVYRILGLEPQSIPPSLEIVLQRVHPDDFVYVCETISQFQTDLQPLTYTHRIIRPDGAIRWLDVHIEPAQEDTVFAGTILGVIHDITDRKLAEIAVQASEIRWKTVIEALSEGIIIFDNGGQRSHWNEAALTLHGLPKGHVWNGNPADCVGVFELRTLEGQIVPFDEWPVNRMLRGESVTDLCLSVTRPDEDWKKFLRFSGAIIDAGSESPEIGFLTIIDETASREAEARLRMARDQLEVRVLERTLQLEHARNEAESANRAKTEFLSRMSHELRTPMNGILGFAQILEMSAEKQKDKDRIGHILQSGEQLLQLIDEILDLTRFEGGRLNVIPEPVNVASALIPAVEFIRPACREAGVSLRVHSPGSEATVLADQERLIQVLINLLSNAVKYNRPRGSVAVGCDLQTGNNYRIWVRDTGTGISPEKLSHLFQPFERLGLESGGIPGTGLGLALSQRLVQAMGGSIGVSSTESGSTFWVDLPAVFSVPATVSPLLDTSAQSTCVLCIEDNLANLDVIQDVLGDIPNLRLLTAMQGQFGIEFAEQHSPDVILLDLNLPDMKAEDVLRELRAKPSTSQVPVIVFGVEASARRIRNLKDLGAVDFLPKPLEIRRLLALLRKLVESRRDAGELSPV